jgi:flagellar basal body rod protein FlgG
MSQARYVRSQEDLDLAILYLGLCPNPGCPLEMPPLIQNNREFQVWDHTSQSPGCRSWFQQPPVNGYTKLARLGYLMPKAKGRLLVSEGYQVFDSLQRECPVVPL